MAMVQSQLIPKPAAGTRDNRLLHPTIPLRVPCSWRSIRAAQNGRPQFEVDQDKAREALKKLDQELQSISEKPISTPIKKARNSVAGEEFQIREEMPEISGSFLGYTAGVLLLFTIFYNILFYTVIQPAIDLPSDPTAKVSTSRK